MVSEVVPLGVAVAASPLSIVPAILVLFTARPRPTALGYVVGWLVGLLLVTGLTTLVATGADGGSTPTWAAWARIVLGAALIATGVREWMQGGEKTKNPRWMDAIDRLTPRRSVRFGLVLAVANPKVLVLSVAAGLAIGSADVGRTEAISSIALYTAIASCTVVAPLVLDLLLGERVRDPLERARSWLQRNNAAVMAVVLAVIGLLLIVKGLRGL